MMRFRLVPRVESGSPDEYPYEPRAMPLVDFIEETMRILGTDAEEVMVERAKSVRNNAGPGEAAFVVQFNDMMASPK